jgi:TonB family protein
MNIPEEFGNYLLLKKLREDALGETFRAGRVGRDGIDQVVLLRVFNGQGMDGERLWGRISGRAAVQQALRSPNIGSGVDLGKVRSFPYAAYDYVSGKNLATLFAQAARQRQPIPTDHALLISERLALALAAAYETKVQDERVLHGFVVPHLAMISNEGEARLLGFEVAPGLRELWAAGWRHEDVAGYVAPEAAAGGAIHRSDDVYSLGAVLFELLASERLPAEPPGGYGQLVDSMVLPNEGTPLPAGIAALLKKSLVPRDQRIPDALTWHKTISKLMIEGHYSSTTFNLAFFMHSLFRDEIDRENQEIEAEKKLDLPRRQPAAVATPGAATAVTAAIPMAALNAAYAANPANTANMANAETRQGPAGLHDATWAGGPPQAAAHAGAASAGGSRAPLWIGVAAGLLLILGGGGYLLFGRSGGKAAAPAAQPAAPLPAPGAAAAAGGPGSAEEAAKNAAALQAQIQQMIEARSKEMESRFKTQYDDQIRQLQQKLDDSRKLAAEQEREKARAERGGSVSAQEAAAAPAADGRSARAGEPLALPAAGRSGAGTPPGPGAGTSAQREAAALPAASGGAAAAPAAPPVAPAAPPPAPAEAAAASQPQIQVGDLVVPGPGVAVPKVLSRPAAHYPAGARKMNRSAQVLIRVLVDERGRAQEAERQGTPVGLGFDEAALEVARLTTFQPATKDGVRVKMWYVMKVDFVP